MSTMLERERVLRVVASVMADDYGDGMARRTMAQIRRRLERES